MNKLLGNIMCNSGLVKPDDVRNAETLMSIANTLSKHGVTTRRDGDDCIMMHRNFLIGGKSDSVGWLFGLRTDFINKLVSWKNPNDMFIALNADDGRVDIGFDLEKFGVASEDKINLRFKCDIDWLRGMLVNLEGDGMVFHKTWMDIITPEEYSTINDEESLIAVAFSLLVKKVEALNLSAE